MKPATILKLLPLSTVIYLALTIFVLRTNVTSYYIASGALIVLFALVLKSNNTKAINAAGHWLSSISSIGLSAATILTIEKVELLIDPSRITSCSLSPIVACSPVIQSDQASAFGFPNPLIGIFGFAATYAAGMTIVAGATKLHSAWWRTLFGGTVFGVGFSAWLIFQALYRINALCLYCMAVWIASLLLFWLVLSLAIKNNSIKLGRLSSLFSDPLKTITLSIAVLFIILFLRWSEYWTSLF
jgi:uncharacterized membrane protein